MINTATSLCVFCQSKQQWIPLGAAGCKKCEYFGGIGVEDGIVCIKCDMKGFSIIDGELKEPSK